MGLAAMIVIMGPMPVTIVVIVFTLITTAPVIDTLLLAEIHGPLGRLLRFAGSQRQRGKESETNPP
jgi:hypothetical protein